MMRLLRKYLIAGLLVWLPIAATVFIVKLFIDLLDKTLLLLPPEWQPEALLGFSVPGFGVVLAIVFFVSFRCFCSQSVWPQTFRLLGRYPRAHSADS